MSSLVSVVKFSCGSRFSSRTDLDWWFVGLHLRTPTSRLKKKNSPKKEQSIAVCLKWWILWRERITRDYKSLPPSPFHWLATIGIKTSLFWDGAHKGESILSRIVLWAKVWIDSVMMNRLNAPRVIDLFGGQSMKNGIIKMSIYHVGIVASSHQKSHH